MRSQAVNVTERRRNFGVARSLLSCFLFSLLVSYVGAYFPRFRLVSFSFTALTEFMASDIYSVLRFAPCYDHFFVYKRASASRLKDKESVQPLLYHLPECL